ncbi:TonB-dependent receptor [Sphingomonas panacis]|uniref:TonB-dependent receptor n=1 Tax=Sphingomonas panacis TaxID=1560345 RepID=UPI0009F4CFA1|nr:TonB-dependent receptor [Sphingomonas panacis]
MKSALKSSIVASSALLALAWSGAARAQVARDGVAAGEARSADPAAPPAVEIQQDIIVTAQKRSENVQEVPIAVTVVSADQLARRGVQNIQDLSQASASLEFTSPGAAPGGGAFVRGIGTNQVGNATAASSVAVVLDGVVLGNANISDLFDIERVEVLKGPQGTLFGSSVSAGVLNITTKAPQIGETSAYVSSEFAIRGLGAQYSRSALRGALNLPINDTSALRLSGYFYNNNGVSVDRSTGNATDQTNFGFRGRYRWEIGDTLTFNLIGDYNHSQSNNGSGFIWRAAPAGSLLAQALDACGITPGPDNIDNCAGFPNTSSSEIGGVSAQFDLKLGTTTLTSISSYRAVGQTNFADIISINPAIARQYLQNCDFVVCNPVVSLTSGAPGDPERTSRSLITQELRLASDQNHRFEWVVGGYFQRATFDNKQRGVLIAHPSFLGMDITLADAVKLSRSDAEDYAAFGNVTVYLGDATRVIAGARFTHSRVAEHISDPINAGVPDTFYARTTADALTWRAGVQHDFSRGTMVYATVSTGYKAPQISDALSPTARFLTPIKAERPISFEIGVKQTLIPNRLYAAFDGFYTKARNFQTQSCVSAPTGILCSNITVPKVISKGLEFEVFGRLLEHTTVNLSGIFNDAKYPAGFKGADFSDLAGQQLNYAPRLKATVSVEQAIPLTDRYTLLVGGDATTRAKQSMYLSANPKYVVPSQTLLNARVSLKAGDTWSAALFARNLTNRIYPVQIYPSDAFAQGGLWQLIDPNSRRVVGFQFDAHF